MEESKIFRTVNRVNSILFLLLLIGAVGLMVFTTMQVNEWTDKRAVQITEDPADSNSAKIELILGSVNDVDGSNSQYIELRSKFTGGKFTSGPRGGEIRNVLFLTGSELDPTWLFDNHLNHIVRVTPVREYRTDDTTSEVLAMYYQYVTDDTDKDGSLGTNDLLTIAVSNPNGTGFMMLEDGISSVLDMSLSKDATNFVVLFQRNGQVVLNNYDPKTFALKSSSNILDVNGAS